MAECAFCGEKLKPGTGFLFVKKDGTALFFCKRKCEKNLLVLKRSPLSQKWAKAHRETKQASKQEKKPKKKAEAEKAREPSKKKKKRTRRKKKKR
jgi:large subunit ribosomal protein L24e